MITMERYLKSKLKLGDLKVADKVRSHVRQLDKHTLCYYNKITVLKTLSDYSYKKNNTTGMNVNTLMHMRYRHGTQFLIDLFIMTEVYIGHYKNINIEQARLDIVKVLTQIPNYRLLYESN